MIFLWNQTRDKVAWNLIDTLWYLYAPQLLTGNNFALLLFTGDLTFHTLQQIQLDARSETSQTELSLNLKRTAQEKGFLISDNQGEGNCMFFALSEQLDVVKGMRMSQEEIRQTVVHYLLDHSTLVS